jgi:hypothetical protein
MKQTVYMLTALTAGLAIGGAIWTYGFNKPNPKPAPVPVTITAPVAYTETMEEASAWFTGRAGGIHAPQRAARLTTKEKTRKMTSAEFAEYERAIALTEAMVSNPQAQSLAQRYGLNILNITWEDTGRYKGSAVGPNISDMTIQVGRKDPRTGEFRVTCMPVIRFPNFSDKTCDLDPRDFTLLVGNQRGGDLKRISLYDFLENPTAYLSNPDSWRGKKRTLLAPRDTRVLVSAQACFLPVPKQGLATFNPVVFNYQSVAGDPAVLTVLATREGTSVTVIDNKRDAFETGGVWGQRLFHNANGQRASLTGQRLSDYQAQNANKGQTQTDPSVKPEADPGLNMVLLIQIPLKQKRPMRFEQEMLFAASPSAPGMSLEERSFSDVENAVIGHGEMEGPFTEIDNLKIKRDDRFPVRVTVQFYKATSNGIVSETDLKEIHDQIQKVYARSEYVGSLVTQGETGRITEYDGVKVQPPDWWDRFLERHQQNTGESRDVALAKLRRLLGENCEMAPVSDLYLRQLLKRN